MKIHITKQFRPGSPAIKFHIKARLKFGKSESYNWRARVDWYPVGFKLNHRTMLKQFGKLHYLACHSPDSVSKKWKVVYNRYMNKHFGDSRRGSCRYMSTWTCGSWL